MTTLKNLQSFSVKSSLMEAIAYFGGIKKTAEILGVTRQSIYVWLSDKAKNGTPPIKYCKIIEKETKGEIKISDLRPDIFQYKEDFSTPKQSLKKGIALIKQAFNEIN